MSLVSSHLSVRSISTSLRAVLALLVFGAFLGAGPVLAAPPKAAPPPASAPDATPAAEGVVNINTATAEQLSFLPGVGPAKAQRIVEYRARRPFGKVLELARVKGIGPKTVKKLSPWLTVKGPTTLERPVGGKKKGPRTAKAPAQS